MARTGPARVLLPLWLLNGFVQPSLSQDNFQPRRLEASPAAKSPHPQDINSARIDRLLQTAAQHQARGRVAEAFALLHQAQALLERHPDKARSALVLGRLSDGYLLERRLEEASGADGRRAPIHLLDGLPEPLVLERDTSGKVVALKGSVSAGFVREGRFYTRDQAAMAMMREA